jgi:hypothetical protein
MSRSYSHNHERREYGAHEGREARLHELKEHMKHLNMPLHHLHGAHHKKHQSKWGAYFGDPHQPFGGMHNKKRR